MRKWRLTLLASAALGLACNEYNTVHRCWPSAVESCRCETGGGGQRVCTAAARSWSECVCTDAGVGSGGDAGIDATPDAAPDAAPEATPSSPQRRAH